jgi:hypothetical protein
VTFYAPGDEEVFFEWISKIRAIKKWKGVGDEIQLYLPSSTISQKSLREITALFYRYKINMSQLQQLVNDKNREWYIDKKKFWHKRVFGNTN